MPRTLVAPRHPQPNRSDAFKFTDWFLSEKARFLQPDDLGAVHFQPAKIRRKLHAVRARIEVGAQVQHKIDAVSHGLADKIVDDAGAAPSSSDPSMYEALRGP
jgi:hypothetical protein